ncbi:MAG: hypothetical protein D6767_06255, partial [Candidatus Hydrogenedentota bacterium]
DKDKKAKLYLSMAKAYENLGNHAEAANIYANILADSSLSQKWKVLANRRLYLIARKIYDKQEVKKRIASGVRLGDHRFYAKSEQIAKVMAKVDQDVVKTKLNSYKEKQVLLTKKINPQQKEPLEQYTLHKDHTRKKSKKEGKTKQEKEKTAHSITQEEFAALTPDCPSIDPKVARMVLNSMLSIPEREEILRKKYPKQTEILTMDNNILQGPIFKATKNEIQIFTIYGVMRLSRDQIQRAKKKHYGK